MLLACCKLRFEVRYLSEFENQQLQAKCARRSLQVPYVILGIRIVRIDKSGNDLDLRQQRGGVTSSAFCSSADV